MIDADRIRFAAAFSRVARIHREQVDETLLDTWFVALEAMPIEAVEDALLGILRGVRAVDEDRDRSFMPKPAEVLRLWAPPLAVSDVLKRLRWFKAEHALGRRYAAALLPFDQLVIRALGGMEVICDTLEAERERFLVDRYLPEWLETARVRGWDLPPRDSLPTPPTRPLLPPPDENPMASVVRHIGRPMPAESSEGAQRAKILRQAISLVEAEAAQAKPAEKAERRPLTDEEIEERRRVLLAQAERLKKGIG